MKRFFKVFAIACACALAVLAVTACGSSEVSRSTESLSVQSEATESVPTDPIYMLLIGNDSRYKTSEDKKGKVKENDPSYSDTIMLMRLDPKSNSIGILSIPRDTAAEVDGNPEKINAVHLVHGPEALAKEVGTMFGVDVPYYFDLKFIDFESLIDKVGGVYADVPMTISLADIVSGDEVTVNAGPNDLDGVTALVVARVRKAYSDNGEAIRQMLARDIVANAIQAIAGNPSSDAASLATILEGCSDSNMPEKELEGYVQSFLDNGGSISFTLGTAPYDGGIDDTGSWRISRDADVYAQLIAGLKDGSDLTEIVPLPYVY